MDQPHRRRNALTGEWVLVSPHRARRPWLGQQETPAPTERPTYDPGCYLCPGNRRAGDTVNPHYDGCFVFANDYPALLDVAREPDSPSRVDDLLLQSRPVRGECRVICFSPRHDLTLPELSAEQRLAVVHTWIGQARELGRRWRWVQIFENKGAAMGCSNPHPHGQIWAGDALPHQAALEEREQREYRARQGSLLLADYLQRELAAGERLVEVNPHWVLLVPYWAVWPFETLLLPRRPVARLEDLSPEEQVGLAAILQAGLSRYDRLFETSFPYSMGWHSAPGDAGDLSGWVLHAHFYPPLLRSATIRKFMVGYEMLAEPQRDLTPEQAADRLRRI